MNLKELKTHIGVGDWKAYASQLAEKVECVPEYVEQLATGFRKPSPKLARRLASADRRLTLEKLRPDVYGKAA